MYTFTSVYFFETICELKNGLTSTEGHAVVQLVEAPRYKPGGAGSIADGVIGIFHWYKPYGITMALGLTQPLTETSTRNFSWIVKAADA